MRRAVDQNRPSVAFFINGQRFTAKVGDTVLTAVLTQAGHLRMSEFEHQARAGFCLMGACQDCWVATEAGPAVRACSTPLEDGMAFVIEGLPAT